MVRRFVVLLFALIVSLMAVPSFAQTRPAYFDTPATLRVVGTPRPGESLPLVIFLPATGSSAGDLAEYVAPVIGLNAYVALVPDGAPTRAEYSDFGRFTAWFDERISADIERARTTQPVDGQRIYLVGFSLGGDLAWAFLGRHPDRSAGAFVMSSRCAASVSSAAADTLHTRGAGLAFAIGDQDTDRGRGLRAAEQRMRAAHVATQLLVFSGSHQPPDQETLRRGFGFVFDRRR